jgi:predicted lactoylglutathione lyase
MMKGAATIFTVRDLMASVAYYRDMVGFDVTFQYGDPPFYGCMCRDEVSLHLRDANKNAEWVAGNGAIAVFVDDVDALNADLVTRGAKVPRAPWNYAYSMRDFDVADLDGNCLTFGMKSREAETGEGQR